MQFGSLFNFFFPYVSLSLLFPFWFVYLGDASDLWQRNIFYCYYLDCPKIPMISVCECICCCITENPCKCMKCMRYFCWSLDNSEISAAVLHRTHIEFQPLGHLTEFPWMSCDVTRHQPFSIREKRNIRVPLNCVELIPNLISQYRKVHWKFSSFHMIRRKPPSNILSSHHIYNSNRRHSTCKDSRMCVVRVWKIHCVDIYCCAKCE